jgi:hypothetical protein
MFSTSPTSAAASGVIVVGIGLIWIFFALARYGVQLRRSALRTRASRTAVVGVESSVPS